MHASHIASVIAVGAISLLTATFHGLQKFGSHSGSHGNGIR